MEPKSKSVPISPYYGRDAFEESKHPRAPDGKFGSGGGSSGGGGAKEPGAKEKAAVHGGGSKPLRKGDAVKIKPEWQDKGDDKYDWVALEDEDGDSVKITPKGTGLALPPVYTVKRSMLE